MAAVGSLCRCSLEMSPLGFCACVVSGSFSLPAVALFPVDVGMPPFQLDVMRSPPTRGFGCVALGKTLLAADASVLPSSLGLTFFYNYHESSSSTRVHSSF